PTPLTLPRPPDPPHLPSSPTRRSSDLGACGTGSDSRDMVFQVITDAGHDLAITAAPGATNVDDVIFVRDSSCDAGVELGCANARSEEHTSELQSRSDLVCRLLLEKKKD